MSARKNKTRKKNAEPIVLELAFCIQKNKNAKKKRGANFWEVDGQSDLDFRRFNFGQNNEEKHIVFEKNIKSLKKQKRGKRIRFWGI